MNPFRGKVIPGIYMDTWGRLHEIRGPVEEGTRWHPKPSKSLVWSIGGWHFDKDTGRSTYGTHQLVQLPPEEEKKFWIKRLAQLRAVNSLDHLALIKEELDRIKRRLVALCKGKCPPVLDGFTEYCQLHGIA